MEKIYITIDSNNYSNKSIFTYDLNNSYKYIKYIKLIDFQIPNIFNKFTASKNNNTFYVIHDNERDTITIQEGTYTPTTLVAEIQRIFNIETNHMRINYNSITNKITINDNNGHLFSLDFRRESNSDYYNIGYHLGFNETLIENVGSVTSSYQVNLNIEKIFYIKLNNYNVIHNNNINNIFAKLILNENKKTTDNMYLLNGDTDIIGGLHNFRVLETIHDFKIELFDEYYNYINLENYNISMTIELGYIYNNQIINKINSNYIKLLPY